MPKQDPEEAGPKWSPASGRGMTEGWVGLGAGLPGALSGSAALVSGKGVPSVVAVAAAACLCRVSHAGKWLFGPLKLLPPTRCTVSGLDAAVRAQTIVRAAVDSILSLPSALVLQLRDPRESCKELCNAEHRPSDSSRESSRGSAILF